MSPVVGKSSGFVDTHLTHSVLLGSLVEGGREGGREGRREGGREERGERGERERGEREREKGREKKGERGLQ